MMFFSGTPKIGIVGTGLCVEDNAFKTTPRKLVSSSETKENLDWLSKYSLTRATNWAKFSATTGLGVSAATEITDVAALFSSGSCEVSFCLTAIRIQQGDDAQGGGVSEVEVINVFTHATILKPEFFSKASIEYETRICY
nr:hypothetical protein [Tanacetum cinerariifolium]